MRKQFINGVALAGVALLAACGDTKLVGRTLPDETRVIDGPSLAVPPDLSLRPPRDGGDYEALLRAQKGEEARALITGVSGTAVEGGTAAVVPATDAWLVEKTGTTVDPNVRADLENQAKEPQEAEKKGFFKRWFGKDKE